MTPNSDGPCRTGSVALLVWQVAHCCLNSVGPSGGLASGSGICARAALATSIAPQKPSPIARPMTHLARSFVILHHRWRRRILGGAAEAVVVAGCFAREQTLPRVWRTRAGRSG